MHFINKILGYTLYLLLLGNLLFLIKIFSIKYFFNIKILFFHQHNKILINLLNINIFCYFNYINYFFIKKYLKNAVQIRNYQRYSYEIF